MSENNNLIYELYNKTFHKLTTIEKFAFELYTLNIVVANENLIAFR